MNQVPQHIEQRRFWLGYSGYGTTESPYVIEDAIRLP